MTDDMIPQQPRRLPRWLIWAPAIAWLLILVGPARADAAFELLTSAAPDRTAPVTLDGRSVSGPIHVFVAPDAGATQVRFFLDDPTMTRSPRKTERTAPWDFAGSTAADLAVPFDTSTVSDGTHSITAAITLTGGGSQIITATFAVANGPTGLQATPSSLSFTAVQGGSTAPRTVDVAASDGGPVFYSASASVPWLQVTPTSGSTPARLTVAVDATGLAPGSHAGAVRVTAPGLAQVSIPVSLTVSAEPAPDPGPHQLLTSASPDRSQPFPLALRTVSGPVRVFLSPEAGVSRVRFYLDDPTMVRSPRKTEGGAPWDFAGTGGDGSANAFDTTSIPDGLHTITASYDTPADGTKVLSATFRVANDAPSLEASPAVISMAAVRDAGATASVALAMSDGSTAAFAASTDRTWLTVAPTAGSTPAELSIHANTTGLAPGAYGGNVLVSAGGGTLTIPVTLLVRADLEPDQVHLSWTKDPSTTLTVIWRTWDSTTPHLVEYRRSGTAAWSTGTGVSRPSGTAGTLHEVTLEALSPGTAYEYRVRADAGGWSRVFATRTAPAPGPADFDAVYVADTGLIGRDDGLATGTQQVVDEIAELAPDLVLLGGDYAYFNTDKRYGTIDNTIDAWFNQMQPVGSISPMMVSYGNHETLLDERFEDWAPRFATPAGWNERRAYSFDVGDVHFVSIFAVSDVAGLTSGQLQWIEQDILAARAAGKRWIVPFFHVSPFADGRNHPSNLQLRAQLGPLFERLDVKLAIASHDQAYERSYPLVGVPAAMRATSASRSCYGPGDGVTWVKVSPGGKLSNKNGGFAAFATTPPPAWTAFRHNTAHHYSRLRVSAQGRLGLDTYAVLGDGSEPQIVDSFEYRLDGCPPELAVSRSSVQFGTVRGGSAATQTIDVAGSSATDFTVSDNAPWLAVTPTTGRTPAALQVRVDPAGLPAGRHVGTVTVQASGALPATVTVTLDVHDVMVSRSADRSDPVSLHGRAESGRIHVFTLPEAGPTRVRFWLDDASMSGTPRKVESNAPWDFAGSAADGSALPFDASRLASGAHTITAAIDLPTGGPVVVHATFTR